MPAQTIHPLRLSTGGLVALAAAMGIGRFAYTPILPAMAANLALSQAQAGMLASSNFLGYLVGALAASFPGLRGSPRFWLIISMAASSVSTILMAAAGDVTTFLALRFVGGLSSAFVLVFASTVILDRLATMGRSDLSCVHFAGIGVGIVLSALLVNAAGALGVDWRGAWLAVGLAALLATPVVGLLVPPEARATSQAAERGGLRLDRPLSALLAAYFLFGLGYVSTATFLVTIVRGMPDLRSVEPVIWLVVGFAAIPSVAAWTRLGRRIGVMPALGLALVAEAAGVLGSVLSGGAVGAVVAAALVGGTFVPITALGIMAARSLAGSRRRQVVALMTASFGIGSIIAPAIAGALADLTGSFVLPSFIAAGSLTLAAVLALAVNPPRAFWNRTLPQASGA